MTTIAASALEGVMCSDSGWNDGDSRGTVRKVFRVRGDLIGLAGVLGDIQEWLRVYRSKKDPSGRNVTAIRLTPAGHIDTWAGGAWCRMEEKFFAIGTGAMAARGAMMAGASCKQAAMIATKIDAGSFGPVRTYRV